MPLNEKEIKLLEEEIIGSRELDPVFQKEWFELELKNAKKSEQILMNAFRLNKYVRDEERMLANKKAIKEVRNTIEYIEEELKRLQNAL